MNEDILIRPASAEDAAQIAEICRTSLGYECSDVLTQKRLNGVDPSREAVFAAVCGGIAVGFIHAEKYETLYFETLVNILGIAVANDFKRMGIGKRLMCVAEEWAQEVGATGIRLNSGGSRSNAHEFYRAIGFDDEKPQIRFLKQVPRS